MAAISTVLGRVGVNIDSISAETFGEGGVTRIVTKDVTSAKEALERAGFKVKESNLLVAKLIDRPGELGKISSLLSRAGVNIENIFMLSKKDDEALFAFHVDKEDAAKKAIAAYLEEGY